MTRPLLCPSQLAEIRALEKVRPGFPAQMLALFGEAATESLDGCMGAWLSEDDHQLQSFAHRLKGTAASFGALELRQKAEQLEIDAGLEKPIERQRLTDIAQTIEATRQAYEDWLTRT